MYIYIGENAHWDIYAPPPCKSLHKKFFNFFFFHFRCILLQISHKKCFFISISILGRSGVNGPVLGRQLVTRCYQFACTMLNYHI